MFTAQWKRRFATWMRHAVVALAMICGVGGTTTLTGQAQQEAVSGDGIWQVVAERTLTQPRTMGLVGEYSVVRLNRSAFQALMRQAPREGLAASGSGIDMTLPMPDGTFKRYRAFESPILVPELSAMFPEIKTYAAQGIDDPTETARFGWTYAGFHAIVLGESKSVYIDAYSQGDLDHYVSYRKDSLLPHSQFTCLVGGSSDLDLAALSLPNAELTNGATLRTYRLALAATGEYTVAAGGTKALALSRMTATMNRVNGIYQRDLSVTMTVATGTGGDPTALIYTNGATDPYTNNSGATMLGENQTNIDTVVGTANYDIGHVFSTGGGGIASLQSPCNAAIKARGVTGSSNPTGDAFDVDYVAHEMGHQFGGNHTFNGTSLNCGGGNRNAGTAYEPGSGATIMAYAGICDPEDLQRNSLDHFHAGSLAEMVAFITNGGTGGSCPSTAATGNGIPTVNAGADYTVPMQTPFMLTATGSDATGDLTFNWEQYNANGTATNSVATAQTDNGSNPLFRSFSSGAGATRTFPSLPYILNNGNNPPQTYTGSSSVSPIVCSFGTCITGEVLPATARVLTFMVTARDNRAGGGAIATDSANVTVSTAAGPLMVTSPNTAVSYAGNSTQTVTWNVASTNTLAANVKISISTDGGQTFPTVLNASTPNDGSENVTIPNTATTTARIKVEAVGNIFFDISNTNFTITASAASAVVGDVDGDGKTDLAVFRPSTGTWYVQKSGGGSDSVTWGTVIDVPVPGDYDGDGKIDVAVYRPSNGAWYIMKSTGGTVTYRAGPPTESWGITSDVPVVGDYDGDKKADVAVYRPSNGAWYILKSSSGFTTSDTHYWGLGTDRPVPGDYDGDGKTDVAVYRASNNAWYVAKSGGGSTSTMWGAGKDVPVPGDYDGDGKTDQAVWRPSTGAWYILKSTGGSTSTVWGASTDWPVPGDYDGDKKIDVAVFRPSTGTWYISKSTGGSTTTTWGASVDTPPGAAKPLPDVSARGDIDGDRRSDITVWRPSTGNWYVLKSSTEFVSSSAYRALRPLTRESWGATGDTPVPGDYDGDGIGDIAVWRGSTGAWYVLKSSTSFGSSMSQIWGASGDTPTQADYDGDGKTDFAVYRSATGQWYILKSSTGTTMSFTWGGSDFKAVPGDYDGDGVADVAVYGSSGSPVGRWYILKSSLGFVSDGTYTTWGASGDVPVPGDYDGDGKTDIAVYRPSTGTWYVVMSSTGTTLSSAWGGSDFEAVPGDYDGDGKTDLVVWKPTTGTWYIQKSSTNFGSSSTHTWGASGDVAPLRRQ